MESRKCNGVVGEIVCCCIVSALQRRLAGRRVEDCYSSLALCMITAHMINIHLWAGGRVAGLADPIGPSLPLAWLGSDTSLAL